MVQLEPITATMGFEVTGLSAAMLRDRDSLARLRSTLRLAFAASHGLLLIRSLEAWQKNDMVALGSVFGQLEASDVDGPYEALVEGDARVHVFSKVPSARVFDEDGLPRRQRAASSSCDPDRYNAETGRPSWHTDQSFRSPPPRASMMYCVSTPAEGGDTLFASTISAWQALPEEERAWLQHASATHSLAQLSDSFRRFAGTLPGPRATPETSWPLPLRESSRLSGRVDACAETEASEKGAAPLGPEARGVGTWLDADRERSAGRVDHPIAMLHRASGRERQLSASMHASEASGFEISEAARDADSGQRTAPTALVSIDAQAR